MAENPIGGAGGFAFTNGTDPGGALGGAASGAGASAPSQPSPPPTTAQGAQESPGAGEPARGAGGTSAAAPADGVPGNPAGGDAASNAKLAGAAAAVPAAGAAGQVMILAMFINYLKGLMMTMAAIGMNLWNLAVGAALGAAKAVVGGIMAIGGTVSSAVGGAVSAGVAGVTTVAAMVATGALLLGGAVAGVSEANALGQRDGLYDCGPAATLALDKIDGSDTNVDAKTLANAKTIFGVLSAWGMPDENIAGILGNWDAESGVDPTSVQGHFSSPQVMTDEKLAAAADTDNGIGLGQWTFGRNAALRGYADGISSQWWTVETQLGFMISAAEGGNAEIVKGMITTSRGTPAEAALYFHDEWERSADTSEMAQRRAVKAAKWMGMFSGWEANKALADSILAQAGTSVSGANGSRASAVRSDCRGLGGPAPVLKQGGLTLEEATAVMELYKAEGEAFLQSRYGAGGPGDCGFGKADNCVGFSTYFVNKYTSFQQYARGDGIDTAGSMARMMGKELTTTPTAYSVASGPASTSAGHTFVILGIQGDQAVIGEAICGTNHRGTSASLMPLSELTNGSWKFVDVTDLLTSQPATS